uniref:Uncharacterized protein n=1 Tax=Arundo donax TaxID=35708 RepID=A0A0A9D3N9_ARUDO
MTLALRKMVHWMERRSFKGRGWMRMLMSNVLEWRLWMMMGLLMMRKMKLIVMVDMG